MLAADPVPAGCETARPGFDSDDECLRTKPIKRAHGADTTMAPATIRDGICLPPRRRLFVPLGPMTLPLVSTDRRMKRRHLQDYCHSSSVKVELADLGRPPPDLNLTTNSCLR